MDRQEPPAEVIRLGTNTRDCMNELTNAVADGDCGTFIVAEVKGERKKRPRRTVLSSAEIAEPAVGSYEVNLDPCGAVGILRRGDRSELGTADGGAVETYREHKRDW